MIYIVRHGESVLNVENRLTCKETAGALTDLGRKQARLAGNWLARKDITRIYTSRFDRARQTASIIGELLNISPEINDDLGEIDCGELEGRADREAWKQWFDVFHRWNAGEWDARYPGGESYREGFDRLSGAIHAIMEVTAAKNAVIVSHSAITRSIVPYLCVNAAALQRITGLSNTGMIVLEPYDSGRYICQSWNLVEHLQS